MAKKDKKRDLTIKERKFVKELVRTGNATAAVMKAYDPKKKQTAHQMAHQLKNKPKIKAAILTALDKNDLTPDSVIESLKTNIVTGAGVDAKASDSNRAIDIYLKLVGAYDDPEYSKTSKETLKKLEHDELVSEIQRRERLTSKILAEEGVVEN